MWTADNRPRYNRDKLRYPSDLTDAEWAHIEPLIPPGKPGGGKRRVAIREVINGVMYILSTGCQWRALPKDLPPRSTVHDYLGLWNWDGTLDRIHHALYLKCREKAAREASPTACIIDSQILINKHAIDLGDGSTPSGQPCFRTTLSAGDKSTLALAFFIAQLDHDPKKADRVVVFDDPFNSQDRSRRERTAELLKKYGRECAQLLLFSHDPHFLNLVHSKLPKAERHSLQLSRAPDNATTIQEWEVEKETQDGYFKVSVRPDRSAAHRESAIVSANDSGHYGFLDGASYKAALDRRREAVDLFSDDGIGHIGCPGGASICDECDPDFQMAA